MKYTKMMMIKVNVNEGDEVFGFARQCMAMHSNAINSKFQVIKKKINFKIEIEFVVQPKVFS